MGRWWVGQADMMYSFPTKWRSDAIFGQIRGFVPTDSSFLPAIFVIDELKCSMMSLSVERIGLDGELGGFGHQHELGECPDGGVETVG